jgi:hypothetical protein
MLNRITTIIGLLCISVMAQEYYEASGQTQVFTLTAGARGNPSSIANKNQSIAIAAPHLQVISQHGVYLHLQNTTAKATVSIYTIAGKRILNIGIDSRAPVAISKGLSSGIYFARLAIDSRVMQTVRFRMVR